MYISLHARQCPPTELGKSVIIHVLGQKWCTCVTGSRQIVENVWIVLLRLLWLYKILQSCLLGLTVLFYTVTLSLQKIKIKYKTRTDTHKGSVSILTFTLHTIPRPPTPPELLNPNKNVWHYNQLERLWVGESNAKTIFCSFREQEFYIYLIVSLNLADEKLNLFTSAVVFMHTSSRYSIIAHIYTNVSIFVDLQHVHNKQLCILSCSLCMFTFVFCLSTYLNLVESIWKNIS